MRQVCLALALLLATSFSLAQDSSTISQDNSKDSKGQITVRGCVSKSSGDYILEKQNPAITYELQASGKIKLSHYLGQRVEITGATSPSMPTSSDSIEKGAPSAITLSVSSIRTISKECTAGAAQ